MTPTDPPTKLELDQLKDETDKLEKQKRLKQLEREKKKQAKEAKRKRELGEKLVAPIIFLLTVLTALLVRFLFQH